MDATTERGPFEAIVLATFSVSGRGMFVEIEIVRGTVVRGSLVSIETSEGERRAQVHAVEYVDHHVRNPPEGHVALGVSGLDENATPAIGGKVRRVYACPCCRHLTLSERGGFEIVRNVEDPALLLAAAREHGGPELEEIAMSAFDTVKAEGKAEGRAEGKAEGKAELVLRMLRLRFGELPSALVEHVAAASPDALDAMADRILTAKTPQDVIA